MQNLGDLEGFVVGIAEVLYSYSISPMNTGEGGIIFILAVRRYRFRRFPRRIGSDTLSPRVIGPRYSLSCISQAFSLIWRTAGRLWELEIVPFIV